MMRCERHGAVSDAIHIRRASSSDAARLAEVLVDCVDGGASVGFMAPLSAAKAAAFWKKTLKSAEKDERVVLVAEDVSVAPPRIVGTVQLVTAMPENQPHRSDVAKMLVHRDARRRGVGERLLRAVEALARQEGKTLLVLDTVTNSDAYRLYARLGWQRSGDIPGYAMLPNGPICSTTVFYRELALLDTRLPADTLGSWPSDVSS